MGPEAPRLQGQDRVLLLAVRLLAWCPPYQAGQPEDNVLREGRQRLAIEAYRRRPADQVLSRKILRRRGLRGSEPSASQKHWYRCVPGGRMRLFRFHDTFLGNRLVRRAKRLPPHAPLFSRV